MAPISRGVVSRQSVLQNKNQGNWPAQTVMRSTPIKEAGETESVKFKMNHAIFEIVNSSATGTVQ